jgi:hypothetical protein
MLEIFVARRTKLAALSLTALGLALVSTGTSTAVAPTLADSSSTWAAPITFHDKTGSPALTIQLQVGRLDTGRFDLRILGVGDYSGSVPITQAAVPSSPCSTAASCVSVGSSGTATIPAQFIAAQGGSPSTVALIIHGTVNMQGYQAIFVVFDATRNQAYSLVTDSGSPAQAAALALQAGNAMMARDFSTLYTELAPEAKTGTSLAQFTQVLESQSTPAITSISPSGAGRSATTKAGQSYYMQPMSVQARRDDGTSYTFSMNIYLVLEQGSWYVVTSDTPPS